MASCEDENGWVGALEKGLVPELYFRVCDCTVLCAS